MNRRCFTARGAGWLAAPLLGQSAAYAAISTASGGRPPDARIDVNPPAHSMVATLENCARDGLAKAGQLDKRIFIEAFGNASSGGEKGGTTPSDFKEWAVATVQRLGFEPLEEGVGTLARSMLKPDFTLRGTVAGVDSLIRSHKETMERGLNFGGGRGGTQIGDGGEQQVSVGRVIVTCNLGGKPEALSGPVLTGKPIDILTYRTVASSTVTSEFRLMKTNSRIAGSLLLGIGGGYAIEQTDVNDIHSCCLHAVRLSIVSVIAQHLKLNTGLCRAS